MEFVDHETFMKKGTHGCSCHHDSHSSDVSASNHTNSCHSAESPVKNCTATCDPDNNNVYEKSEIRQRKVHFHPDTKSPPRRQRVKKFKNTILLNKFSHMKTGKNDVNKEDNSVFSMKKLLGGFIILALIFVIIYISIWIYYKSNLNGNTISWTKEEDHIIQKLWTYSRGIDRISVDDLSLSTFEEHYKDKKPLIITGIISKWPAKFRWRKHSFIDRYGARKIQVGSGHDIFNRLDERLESRNVSNFLVKMRTEELQCFDENFLKYIPELAGDLETPEFFKYLENKSSSSDGLADNSVKSVLSIGPSRAGAPFHVSGELWLGLVFGSVRWFLYPIGTGLENVKDVKHFSLYSSMKWLTNIYPALNQDEKPIEFMQIPGDIVYIPSGWKRSTLNIGETVAVGKKASYDPSKRLKDSVMALNKNPDDFDANYGAGISLVHLSKKENELDIEILEQGIERLKKAVSLRPLQIDVCLVTADALIATQKSDYIAEANNMIRTYAKQFKNDRKKVLSEKLVSRMLVKLGRFFLKVYNYNSAELYFRDAINLNKFDPEVWFDLALAYYAQNKIEEVEFSLDRTVALLEAKSNNELSQRIESLKLEIIN